MRFDEVTKRIIGLNCPVFGIRWVPPDADRDAACRVIRFLETCGILYRLEAESTHDYIDSVHRIQDMLNIEISECDVNSGLYHNLKGIRFACRKFLKKVQPEVLVSGKGAAPIGARGTRELMVLAIALGELRATVGIHVACIASQYGQDVDDQLASILPVPEYDHLLPFI